MVGVVLVTHPNLERIHPLRRTDLRKLRAVTHVSSIPVRGRSAAQEIARAIKASAGRGV
jgi:hypothetical protein